MKNQRFIGRTIDSTNLRSHLKIKNLNISHWYTYTYNNMLV